MNTTQRTAIARISSEAERRRAAQASLETFRRRFDGGVNESIDFAEARRRRLARQQFWVRLRQARDLRLLRYSFAFFFIAGVLAIWLYQSLR